MPPVAGELLAAGGTFIHRRVHRRVIKHACGTKVTKFWRYGILPGEPEAMRFVAEHTTIPVPRVYDVGEDYFTMDFIEGESLYRACDTTLSPEDKALMCRQMRGYISELRAIKSPDGTICSFGGRPAIDDRRIVRREGGPFADEAAYNEFLLDTVRGLDIIRDMIRKKMRTDHEIVLTNGGLDPRNILVRPGVGVVGIIDWSYAGYYPEYFDLLHSFRPFDDGSSAYNNVFQMFPQRYDDEWFVDQVLTLYSRH
jgi:aminoglycoside phosphotransferase (APT) family kinase protein